MLLGWKMESKLRNAGHKRKERERVQETRRQVLREFDSVYKGARLTTPLRHGRSDFFVSTSSRQRTPRRHYVDNVLKGETDIQINHLDKEVVVVHLSWSYTHSNSVITYRTD
jgi:hypothetical protein